MARSSSGSSGFFSAGGRPWAGRLINNEKGSPKSILYNAMVALSEDPAFAPGTGVNAIRFDSFRNQTMISASLPWNINGQIPRAWTDQDDREVTSWLQDNGVICGELTAASAVQAVAERNRYHPVMDYLSSIAWDGVPRIGTWLIKYIGAPDTEYIRAVGQRWLISGIARIEEPGCKADCVLIFEGPQGILKSTAFAVLGGPFYSNDIAAIGTKDAQEQILGNWIVELDELEAVTRASDLAHVKAFVSRGTDKFRLPYGHRSHAHPRQTIFGATTNRETWQKDETGARRWWPVRCGVIDIESLRWDRDQLWAEAREFYHQGEPWWLDVPRLVELAKLEQDARFEADPWEEIILQRLHEIYIKPTEGVGFNDLLQLLGIPVERRGPAETTRISRVLRHLGWERKLVDIGAKRFWRYFPR